MSTVAQTSTLERTKLLKKLKAEQKIKDIKPVVHAPKIIDKIFHRSQQKRSVYYFTTGRKINENVLKKITDEKDAFTLPPLSLAGIPYNVFRKEEREQQRAKESKLRVEDKPSRRTRFMENIAERLYVPSDDDFKMKRGKQDLDPQFYEVVQGRPIKDTFEVRKFTQNIRESLLTQLKTGYLQDEIALIDEHFRNEKNKINEICEEYKDYYSSFKDFEAQDREQWLKVRRYSEEMAGKTNVKKGELKHLLKELSYLKSSLYVLEESWRNCKLCQIFLFEISPKSWQDQHPLIAKGHEEFNFKKMLDRYKLDTEGDHSLIEIFQEDIANDAGDPELFFTEPWQVRLVFREMELQHISSLLIIEGLRKPKDVMTHGLNAMVKYYDHEIQKIQEELVGIESMIQFEEERAKQLEDLAQELLNTDLRNLVASDSAILSNVYVKHAYEDCVGSGQTDMSTLETLEGLKLLFEDLMLKLDSLPVKIVRHAEQVVKSKTLLSLERAHQAERRIAYLDGLTKSMKRALEKPFVKRGRPLMFRSEPPPTKHKKPPPPKEFTLKELEYLTFFTDYCEHEDKDVNLFLPLGFIPQ